METILTESQLQKLVSFNLTEQRKNEFQDKYDSMSDEAKEILLEALKTKETKSLCLLMAQIDDKIAWQNRAENAIADKTWHCRVTGARYPFWQLYSDSGELNTIVYGYLPESAKVAFGSTKYLIT